MIENVRCNLARRPVDLGSDCTGANAVWYGLDMFSQAFEQVHGSKVQFRNVFGSEAPDRSAVGPVKFLYMNRCRPETLFSDVTARTNKGRARLGWTPRCAPGNLPAPQSNLRAPPKNLRATSEHLRAPKALGGARRLLGGCSEALGGCSEVLEGCSEHTSGLDPNRPARGLRTV
jgi:hypothetical protein